MKVPLAIFLMSVCVVASVASASQQFVVCVDFDEDGVPESELRDAVYPAADDWVSAYILVRRRPGVPDPAAGFYSISFRIYTTPGTSAETRCESLIPGGLQIGDWSSGITLMSAEGAEINCLEEEYVFVARVDLRYAGSPGDVRIYSDPNYSKWIADCALPEPEIHAFCVSSHGGVGKSPDPADIDCYFADAVRPMTWGAMKALYAP